MPIFDLTGAAGDAMRRTGQGAADLIQGLTTPTIRLGVTGLARAGKTVFITSLVRNLTESGRLPFFSAQAEGRIQRIYLEPQPDDAVPRFAYEEHLAALGETPPRWPESTRAISQLRLTIEYAHASSLRRVIGTGRLHVDIIDYPGEWLIDLPMLEQDYGTWAREALALSHEPRRHAAAQHFHQYLTALPTGRDAEQIAIDGARIFTEYLGTARAGEEALSTTGPGRFLMPGDLAGSPLLTFFPLGPGIGEAALRALLARRFESYKTHVVKPFFTRHFARLDRQIVLVDALSAINTGRDGVADLKRTLAAILSAFRPGQNTWLSRLVRRRVDRIVFAASKADHLHHTSHDRLEAALRMIVDDAMERATFAGAEIKVLATAALRATREAERRDGDERLACIVGVPLAGEKLGDRTFDGKREVALFPGDLPEDPKALLSGDGLAPDDVRVLRFRPERIPPGSKDAVPHIRIDRAIEFLIGDKLS